MTPPDYAHLTRETMPLPAFALAKAVGEELEALCGFRRAPEDCPLDRPVCPECRRLAEAGAVTR